MKTATAIAPPSDEGDCPICGQPLWFIDQNGLPLSKAEYDQAPIIRGEHHRPVCELCGDVDDYFEEEDLRSDPLKYDPLELIPGGHTKPRRV